MRVDGEGRLHKPEWFSARSLEAADRMIEIVLMHDAGKTFTDIGRVFSVSRGRASALYKNALHNPVVRWRWLERMLAFNERMRASGH